MCEHEHHAHGAGALEDDCTEDPPMMDHGSMMSMFFHFGVSETVLFKFWKTSNAGEMIGSIIFVFFLAVAYEALKFFREYLHRAHLKSVAFNTVTVPIGNGISHAKETQNIVQLKMLSGTHAAQTILHMVQFVISYLLMLIFMTYNVWLCIGVVLGAGVGYFLFGWQRSVIVDITEHCH